MVSHVCIIEEEKICSYSHFIATLTNWKALSCHQNTTSDL